MIEKPSAHIIELVNDNVNNSSGWRLSLCEALFYSFASNRPFRGKSHIKTPLSTPKRAVINVKNTDNSCFEWAVFSVKYLAGPNA